MSYCRVLDAEKGTFLMCLRPESRYEDPRQGMSGNSFLQHHLAVEVMITQETLEESRNRSSFFLKLRNTFIVTTKHFHRETLHLKSPEMTRRGLFKSESWALKSSVVTRRKSLKR